MAVDLCIPEMMSSADSLTQRPPPANAPDEPLQQDIATAAPELNAEVLAGRRPATVALTARKRQKRGETRGNLAQMCNDFVNTGLCPFGHTCRFAHSQSELKPSMRSAEVPAARKRLQQRVAERRAAATRTAQTQRSMQDLPSFVSRYCREMFWVSPIDPMCTPLFQNHLALAAHGPIAVPQAERRTCTDQDQYINMHKNELCIIGVAKTHSMFAENRTVIAVCYKQDCSEVSGKKKKGAVKCDQCSVLAVVTCDDGTEWPIKVTVPSKLIEINARVVADPSLLQVHLLPNPSPAP